MVTTNIGNSPSRTTRRSPIEAAVAAAQRQLSRMQKRKARAVARIGKIEARLEKAKASIGQYDTVLKQLEANIKLLAASANPKA
jgi:chromosome segregation ATPase